MRTVKYPVLAASLGVVVSAGATVEPDQEQLSAACERALRPYSQRWVGDKLDEVVVYPSNEPGGVLCKAAIDVGSIDYPISVIYLVHLRLDDLAVVSIDELAGGKVRRLQGAVS